MTANEFLIKYDNKEEFTEDELHDIFWGDIDIDKENNIYCSQVDEEVSEPDRWTYAKTHILKFQGENDLPPRYFSITAWLGNTEMQENYYESQPVEVKPIEVVVRNWEAI